MTEKQKRFCDEYLIDCNATQAAIRAGYSAKTAAKASDWLNAEAQEKPSSDFNKEMYDFIQKRLAEKESELIANQDEVLKYLTSVLRGKSQSSVLARDEIGAERVIEKPPDEKERLKAAELLGKRYGLLKEAVDLEVKQSEKLADVMAQIGGDGLEE